MSDVAIVGIGMHPFGRHEGVSTIEMGIIVANRALKNAGVRWQDINIACGGSLEVLHPDNFEFEVVGATHPESHPVENADAELEKMVVNLAPTRPSAARRTPTAP